MGRINSNGDDLNDTLLPYDQANLDVDEENQDPLASRIWTETKKLWKIVGPAIFSRVATFSMNIITQAFAGHLGDVELAAISIANTVIVGFNFGLLLGMASALETMCGQAFGAKRYHMLGIYMQRSWIVLFFCCFLLLPFYVFAAPLLKLLGQPDDVAELSGVVAVWMIPLHFSFAFQFPLQRFLQSQLKNQVIAWISLLLECSYILLVVGVLLLGLGFRHKLFLDSGNLSNYLLLLGVMLCLENWYYRILILMTGYLDNATLAVDALSVCMSINGWEIMIPLAFFAAAGVRVSNELGAGNGKGAKFATIVSVVQSSIVGLVFCLLIMLLHNKIALIFTSSSSVIHEVDNLAFLLAITILLNSVQPVLSGVAVGAGWQAAVAYVNLGCYYIVGLPLGFLIGWVFKLGVKGIWSGMIFGGTAVQTVILVIMTVRSDWDKEAEKARINVNKWSQSKPVVQ
ncbi:hypothetical protein OIU78_012157 [Salix suchowensis]|nr:hypothetical protein OIU78_012157 [Salix suchowensis]